MTTGNWLTVVGFSILVFLSIYGFVYRLDKRVGVIENRCENHQVVIDSIATLNTKLDKVTNDNEIFWKVIGPHLENIIHSPKSVDRDVLVRKLNDGTIGADELSVLINLLRDALGKPEWDEEKRFAGIMLLAWATQLMNTKEYDRRQERRFA